MFNAFVLFYDMAWGTVQILNTQSTKRRVLQGDIDNNVRNQF